MSGMYNLPAATALALQQQLLVGERLLWAAQPQVVRATRRHFGIWFFAIPWTLLSLLFFGASFGSLAAAVANLFLATPIVMGGNPMPLAMSLLFSIFTLPFVLLGLALLASPFYTMRQMALTAYAITSQRVLQLEIKPKKQVITSMRLCNLGTITAQPKRDGSGTLVLQTGFFYRDSTPVPLDSFRIMNVPQLDTPERLLIGLQEEYRKGGAA